MIMKIMLHEGESLFYYANIRWVFLNQNIKMYIIHKCNFCLTAQRIQIINLKNNSPSFRMMSLIQIFITRQAVFLTPCSIS